MKEFLKKLEELEVEPLPTYTIYVNNNRIIGRRIVINNLIIYFEWSGTQQIRGKV